MFLDLVTKQGFFCDDTSIMYPYRPSTVTAGVLFSIGLYSPLIILSILEWWHLKSRKSSQYISICGRYIHPLFKYIPRTLFFYYFGYSINLGLTYLIKLSAGRLRPNFIAICQPDWSAIHCTTPEDHPAYVDPIPCTNTNYPAILEARLSFPSGHASITAYTMVYYTMYLQAKFHLERLRLGFIKPLLQLLCTTTAVYVSLTRVPDFKHHATDVMAGVFLGTLIAIFTVTFISDIMNEVEDPYEKPKVVELDMGKVNKRNVYERIAKDDVDDN